MSNEHLSPDTVTTLDTKVRFPLPGFVAPCAGRRTNFPSMCRTTPVCFQSPRFQGSWGDGPLRLRSISLLWGAAPVWVLTPTPDMRSAIPTRPQACTVSVRRHALPASPPADEGQCSVWPLCSSLSNQAAAYVHSLSLILYPGSRGCVSIMAKITNTYGQKPWLWVGEGLALLREKVIQYLSTREIQQILYP